MALTQWQDKYLLKEEIEIFLEKEFAFAVNCCVRGYHIFKSFWDAPIGSVLSSKHEHDPQALINNEWVTVGHLPKFMSKLAHFFVTHAGKIRCEITGSKRYSSDLWFGDSSKNSISEFKQTNNWRNEKEICSSYRGM